MKQYILIAITIVFNLCVNAQDCPFKDVSIYKQLDVSGKGKEYKHKALGTTKEIIHIKGNKLFHYVESLNEVTILDIDKNLVIIYNLNNYKGTQRNINKTYTKSSVLESTSFALSLQSPIIDTIENIICHKNYAYNMYSNPMFIKEFWVAQNLPINQTLINAYKKHINSQGLSLRDFIFQRYIDTEYGGTSVYCIDADIIRIIYDSVPDNIFEIPQSIKFISETKYMIASDKNELNVSKQLRLNGGTDVKLKIKEDEWDF